MLQQCSTASQGDASRACEWSDVLKVERFGQVHKQESFCIKLECHLTVPLAPIFLGAAHTMSLNLKRAQTGFHLCVVHMLFSVESHVL